MKHGELPFEMRRTLMKYSRTWYRKHWYFSRNDITLCQYGEEFRDTQGQFGNTAERFRNTVRRLCSNLVQGADELCTFSRKVRTVVPIKKVTFHNTPEQYGSTPGQPGNTPVQRGNSPGQSREVAEH